MAGIRGRRGEGASEIGGAQPKEERDNKECMMDGGTTRQCRDGIYRPINLSLVVTVLVGRLYNGTGFTHKGRLLDRSVA